MLLREKIRLPQVFPKDPRYVRVATFTPGLRDRAKSEKAHVIEALALIIAQFDIVALQNISTDQIHVVGTIVDVINATGRKFNYVAGPRVGREHPQNQFVYLYDASRVEVDQYELYTVEDPDDLLNWEPFVAWFRAKGPDPDNAFTFSLVNVQSDPLERDRENTVLGGVFRAVRNDRRGEDDVILLGHFAGDAAHVQQLARLPDPQWAVTDIATDTQATGQFDNIVWCRQFTDEATGRSGVFDFLRQLNLSMEQALEISEHLPVWTEFSRYEGGYGTLATKPAD